MWLLFPAPALALLWLLYRIIQALKPAPTGPVVAPELRTGTVPGKKIEKKPEKKTGASIEHGRPTKPPMRQ